MGKIKIRGLQWKKNLSNTIFFIVLPFLILVCKYLHFKIIKLSHMVLSLFIYQQTLWNETSIKVSRLPTTWQCFNNTIFQKCFLQISSFFTLNCYGWLVEQCFGFINKLFSLGSFFKLLFKKRKKKTRAGNTAYPLLIYVFLLVTKKKSVFLQSNQLNIS